MSHSITFHCVYFELSTVPKRETIEGSRSWKSFPVVFRCVIWFPSKQSQKIAINRKKSQKIHEIDCDFFPNEKIDLNGSILAGTVTTRAATVSNYFVGKLPGAHPPDLLGATHLRFLVWHVKRLAFGPGRVLPRSQGKKDRWPTIPYGPISDEKWSQTHIYKNSWSHGWWEMVPTAI